MSNTLWSLAVIAVLAGFIVLGRLINRDGSRVMLWHNVVWIFVLALLATNLMAYYEASATSWLVLIVGLVAFNIAALLAFSLSDDSKHSILVPETVAPVISRSFLYAATAIYFAAFAVYLNVISNTYGLDVLVSDPGSIRALPLDGESYLSKTPLLARLGLNLGPVLLVIYAVRSAVPIPLNIWFRVAMLAAISISMIAMLQRTNFFIAVLWYLAYLLSQRSARHGQTSGNALAASRSNRQVRNPKALLGFILGPLALFGSFQFLGNALGKAGNQDIYSGRVNDVLVSSGLADIFSYATGGIPAFLQLVESENFRRPPETPPGTLLIGDYNPQTYGTASLGPIAELIPGVPTWDPIAPFIDVGFLTNVFTWYELPFRDFRLLGVFVYAALLGFGLTWMFIRRFKSPTIFWVQSALFSTVFLSVFIAKTSTVIFWTGIIFVVLTSQSLKRKAVNANSKTFE
ncbi:hypothetical protein CXX84_03515 [Arthrobacter sp. AFG7.2]|uniref:O-antigen polymerase n=1 Tax=Arthrobacter sp. AFG7.2 TaxID=1688693 RepID=UPI000C9EBAA3|nr:O-antigen polymerase [Arthrobacter sp. AFG7.2]PNI10531.1 hypothetical protein CXX84_03515 [Arthrobacter sp. AFG7.2]